MPKGALHVHGSLVAQALTTRWVLDVRDDDVYWCTADPGWVTGVSYGVIGPWSLGITQVVLECGFIADRWYKAIQDHKVSMWYSAPTAIRLLMKEGEEKPRQYDLSSLRHLASVGEPLNPEAVVWSERATGCRSTTPGGRPRLARSWSTNVPGLAVKPGSMGQPFPGVTAAVLSDDFESHHRA